MEKLAYEKVFFFSGYYIYSLLVLCRQSICYNFFQKHCAVVHNIRYIGMGRLKSIFPPWSWVLGFWIFIGFFSQNIYYHSILLIWTLKPPNFVGAMKNIFWVCSGLNRPIASARQYYCVQIFAVFKCIRCYLIYIYEFWGGNKFNRVSKNTI